MRRDTVIDPEGREIEFGYDDAGRVTEQSFITDGREVAFGYDPNGNLTALDVPAASAPAPRHEFAYTLVNLESSYTPPDSDWPGDGAAVPTGYRA